VEKPTGVHARSECCDHLLTCEYETVDHSNLNFISRMAAHARVQLQSLITVLQCKVVVVLLELRLCTDLFVKRLPKKFVENIRLFLQRVQMVDMLLQRQDLWNRRPSGKLEACQLLHKSMIWYRHAGGAGGKPGTYIHK